MSFVGEFRAFALKGNVIDLAVGVIIGGAFGKIVDAAVGDLIMPLVGLALGLSLIEARRLGAVFAYGSFITVALNFLILAFVIFVMVRQMNRLIASRSHTPTHPTPEDTLLLREIRDHLTRTP